MVIFGYKEHKVEFKKFYFWMRKKNDFWVVGDKSQRLRDGILRRMPQV